MITFSVKRIAVAATVGLSAVCSYTSNLVAQNTFEPSLLVGEWSEAGQCNNSRHVFTPDGRYREIENQQGKWTTSFQGIYRITASDRVAIAENPNAGGIALQISSLSQTMLSAKLSQEGYADESPVTYTRCSVAAVSPASPSTATKPRASGVQPSQTNSTGVSGTSLATQPVGTAKCSGIQGDNANTRPIQKATLEPRAGGYNLRLTEIKQGTPVESLLELNNQLQVQSARTLGSQGGEWNNVVFRGTPVKIQPTGAFSISMMVSTRSACDFSGTLQFAGNAQAQLFPGSSTQARNPSQPTPSAAKIAEGVYWVGTTGMALEVKGGQYQYRDEETTTSWKPISELTPIKDGVLKTGETYWCLSTLPQPQNSRLAVCSASGWTVSPPIASNPSPANSASNSPTSKPPFVSSPIQIVPSPGKSPVASPSPSPTPQPSPSPIPSSSPTPQPSPSPIPSSSPTPQPSPSSIPSPSPTPSSPRVIKVPPPVKPPEWVGRNTQSNIPESAFSDANSACQSYGDPKTNPVTKVELLYVNNDESQGVYGAYCYHKLWGDSPHFMNVFCPPEENDSYLANYRYFSDAKDKNKGECRRVELIGKVPTDSSFPVAQQPQGTEERTPEPLPTPLAQKPQDSKEPSPSPSTPSRNNQVPNDSSRRTNPGSRDLTSPSVSPVSSSDSLSNERGIPCIDQDNNKDKKIKDLVSAQEKYASEYVKLVLLNRDFKKAIHDLRDIPSQISELEQSSKKMYEDMIAVCIALEKNDLFFKCPLKESNEEEELIDPKDKPDFDYDPKESQEQKDRKRGRREAILKVALRTGKIIERIEWIVKGINSIRRARNIAILPDKLLALEAKYNDIQLTINSIKLNAPKIESTLEEVEQSRQSASEKIYKIIDQEIYQAHSDLKPPLLKGGVINAESIEILVQEMDAYIDQLKRLTSGAPCRSKL